MFKRILVPVDFSDRSLEALDRAVDFGRDYAAALVVLHVVEPVYLPGSADAFGGGYDSRLVYEELEHSARERLMQLAADLARRRVPARPLLRAGTPHQVIVDVARRLKADLIMMSTHGRTGLSHLAMGSVAERVVRTATCPVMTLRAAPPPPTRRRQGRVTRRRAPRRAAVR